MTKRYMLHLDVDAFYASVGEAKVEKLSWLSQAVDQIREKYGDEAIQRASLVTTLHNESGGFESKFHRRGALDVFTPGRYRVAMAGNDGDSAVDARRGGSEIEGQLLGTLVTMNVGRVLVPVDTMDKRPLASAPVLYYSLPGGVSCQDHHPQFSRPAGIHRSLANCPNQTAAPACAEYG